MRTSLNNVKAIDDYIFGALPPGDALLFEANTLLNSSLAGDVAQQRLAHKAVKQYGRQAIRAEIAAVQNKLAALPAHRGFMQRIANFFKK